MNERAIIVVDGSRDSSEMILYLRPLKELLISSLILLYLPRYQNVTLDIFPYIAQLDQQRLINLKMALIESGFKVKEHLVFDSLVATCHRFAQSEEVSFVVLFTKESTFLTSLLTPELSKPLIKRYTNDLLILPLKGEDHPKSFQSFSFLSHLLFYTDFSLSSQHAFKQLLLFISSIGCANLTILSEDKHMLSKEDKILERQKLEQLVQQVKSVGVAKVNPLSLSAGGEKAILQIIDELSISLLLYGVEKPFSIRGYKKMKNSCLSLCQSRIPSLVFTYNRKR
jgi:hypothetical protein